jgi:replication factor C subunit 2/4
MEEGGMEVLGKVSGGDMRKAITTLQSASSLHGSHVGPTDILHVAGVIPDEGVAELMTACRAGSFEKAQRAVEELGYEGFPAMQVRLWRNPKTLNPKP